MNDKDEWVQTGDTAPPGTIYHRDAENNCTSLGARRAVFSGPPYLAMPREGRIDQAIEYKMSYTAIVEPNDEGIPPGAYYIGGIPFRKTRYMPIPG